MRAANPTPALRASTALAAAAALFLSACGSSEEPGGAKERQAETARVAQPAPAAPAPKAQAPASTPTDEDHASHDQAAGEDHTGHDHGDELEAVVEAVAPIKKADEYEVVVDKPLTAAFPKAAEAARPTIEGLPADDPNLGQPLVIGGQLVPFEEVRAQVCLGARGMAEVAAAKLKIYTDEEIERRVAAGEDRATLVVTDEELQTARRNLEEKIKMEYPDGAVTMSDVIGERKEELEAADRAMRMTWLCRKLYLPDDPDELPPITADAFRSQAAGDALFQHYRDRHERLLADPVANAKTPYDLEFDDTIVQQILEYIERVARIEYRPAPGVLYRVNGVDITTDQVWAKLVGDLSESEVRMAKQWIANTTVLREGLKAAGAWLTDEEAEAAYKVYSDPYKDSIFSCERIALIIKRFPSLDRFRQYRHMYESFARLKAPEMTKEELKRHRDARTNRLLGQVTVDVDVILCSVFDLRKQTLKENGWQEAEARMRDVLRLLTEEKRDWEELLERYSEFQNFPAPASLRVEKREERKLKGRFRGYQRNNLLNEFGENDYLLFLTGSSITDFIFFEQEVGSLGDPMKGPMGWYLPRLLRRSDPPDRLSTDEEGLADLIRDDYLIFNLNRYTQQLIKEKGVYGL